MRYIDGKYKYSINKYQCFLKFRQFKTKYRINQKQPTKNKQYRIDQLSSKSRLIKGRSIEASDQILIFNLILK